MFKQGDIIDVIAPSGRCSNEELNGAIDFIESSGLKARVSNDIFSDDLHCSNSLEYRFKDLKKALYAQDSKVIWCIRGGYGSANLYDSLVKLEKPKKEKLLVGFSDITFLHIFVNQTWNWKSLHAPVLSQYASGSVKRDCFDTTLDILFGKIDNFVFEDIEPLNDITICNVETKICGGNLSLIQNSLGTNWQIDTKGKFLLLEDVGECAYKIDRLLVHLTQAGILNNCKAILFGDFTCEGESEKIRQTLDLFANRVNVPVFKINNIGHDATNYPLFLNKKLGLKLINGKWILS